MKVERLKTYRSPDCDDESEVMVTIRETEPKLPVTVTHQCEGSVRLRVPIRSIDDIWYAGDDYYGIGEIVCCPYCCAIL